MLSTTFLSGIHFIILSIYIPYKPQLFAALKPDNFFRSIFVNIFKCFLPFAHYITPIKENFSLENEEDKFFI